MRAPRAVLVAVGLGITASVAAPGQSAGPDKRVWTAFSIGYGGASMGCDSCSGVGHIAGTTASVQVGRYLSNFFRVNATINGWVHSNGNATEGMGSATINFGIVTHGTTEFSIPNGIFLDVGIGLSAYRSGIVRGLLDTIPSLSGTGWGVSVGVGYDIPLSRRLTLSPTARYARGFVGDLHRAADGSPYTTGWNQNWFDVSLGVTFSP